MPGYLTDMGDVYYETVDFERVINKPACNIMWGRETYRNASPGSHSTGYLVKTATVYLDFFMGSPNDKDLLRNRIMADLDKYFGTYPYIPDSLGVATACDCQIESDTPWGGDITDPRCGVLVTISVEYKQNITDPTLTTSGTPAAQDNTMSTATVSRKEDIKNAVQYNLNQIAAGTYQLTMNSTGKIVQPDKMVNFPFVNVSEMSESYEHGTNLHGHYLKEMDLLLECWGKNINEPHVERENIIQDLERRFMNYFYIPDSTGKRTVSSCMFLHNDPWGIESMKPNCGVDVALRVWYRQLETNAVTA
jgi:hypothetical protein